MAHRAWGPPVKLVDPKRSAAFGSTAMAIALALACVSCAAATSPTGTAATPTPSAQPSATSLPTEGPTALPSPAASEPLAWGDAYVASGLALVRHPADGSPASQVFVVEADGTLRQLTGFGSTSSTGASLPVWSPDGDHVAFGPPKIGAGPNRFLSVIGADGSDERTVAPLGDEYGLPVSWSPDGSSLLFFDIDAVDGPAMWLADVASGDRRHLGAGQVPRWRPDGLGISFQRAVEGLDPADPLALTQVIYVMDLGDGELTFLARASDAIWAPDGSTVLLQHSADQLLLADAEGSNPQGLVAGWNPVWSPDSSLIAFAHGHDAAGAPLLAVTDREGRVTWSGVPGANPSWSPDGTRIAVEVFRAEPMVQVLDAATGEVLWEMAGSQPAWSP